MTADELAPESPIDTTVAIEAPEQVRFRHRLAGPTARAMAHLLDWTFIVLIFVVAVFLLALQGSIEPSAYDKARIGLMLVVVFLLQWGYFALFEGFWRGQTPGKKMLSLRVVKSGGEPIGFIDAVLRNLLRSADFLPLGYAAGLCAMLIDPRFRRLGDLLAGTMVVIEDRLRVAVPLYIIPPTPHEAQYLPARVLLDAEELRAIEQFLRRAPQLGPALATELASAIAPALGRKYNVYHPDPVRLLALLYVRSSAAGSARALRGQTAPLGALPQGSA